MASSRGISLLCLVWLFLCIVDVLAMPPGMVLDQPLLAKRLTDLEEEVEEASGEMRVVKDPSSPATPELQILSPLHVTDDSIEETVSVGDTVITAQMELDGDLEEKNGNIAGDGSVGVDGAVMEGKDSVVDVSSAGKVSGYMSDILEA